MSKNQSAAPNGDAPGPTEGLLFDDLPLPEPVRAGIRAAGFTRCTPIQEKTLPLSLAGRDVAGQAQTGTGKTAAFLITTFTRLLEKPRAGRPSAPRALVIAPTRELVVQIANDARVLGEATGFSIQAVYGGIDYKKQRDDLVSGVDVLIGTPGRLIDYLKQRVYDLGSAEVLVIDEADRMFDMGFIKDLRFLLRRLPPVDRRQSMLFSATLSFDVMELAYVFMNDAVRVSVTPEQITAENVEHMVYHVSKPEKVHLLVHLLRETKDARILVFVNMRSTAERIVRWLEVNGLAAAAITGDVDQRRRLRILEDFKSGALPILVATDVASRGLHIDGVTHVVNYDVPNDPEDYVHRVGRTARAGASGKAFTLACEDYVEGLEGIQSYIGFKLPFEIVDREMLGPPIVHPPRMHREHTGGRPDQRGGRGRTDSRRGYDRGPRPERRAEPAPAPQPHAPAAHAPASHAPQSHVAPPSGDAPRKKRRRRRRRPGGAAAGPKPPAPAR